MILTREENLRGKPMTDGACAPPCGRLHSLQSWVPVKLLVYHGHIGLVRLSAHTLTSPQSVKSGLRLGL